MPIPAFREDGWLPEGHHSATWEEIANSFGGSEGSKRAVLVRKLLALRDGLLSFGVTGYFLLDGGFISAKEVPKDFDVLLVAPSDVEALKNINSGLTRLLDAEIAEKEHGYSLFYSPENSPAIDIISGMWDETKQVPKVRKGVIRVEI